MSGIVENYTKAAEKAPAKINDEAIQRDRRSESIAKKSLELSTTENARQIVNENRSSVPGDNNNNNDKEEPAKVIDNIINQINSEAINLEDQLTGFSGHDTDEVQPKWRESQFDDSKPTEEIHDSGGVDCACKIKEALSLIVEEIKKVDTTICELEAKSQCPYTPEPDDKKEFAKSVEKNATVCHVIIEELKKQRREINEMLELYEESSQEFTKLEETLKTQREKVDQIESMLNSIEDTVKNVKTDVVNRHETFLSEAESRRTRVETREEILKVFLNWIMTLDSKRFDDREVADAMVREAMEEREKDRATLTLAVGQLQEIRRIETLLVAQKANQTTVPNSLCKCAWPIDEVAIIAGQSDKDRMTCASRGNPRPFFNINGNRCSGGAHGFGVANGSWYSPLPFGLYTNMPGPSNCQHRVPICRLNSPTNCPGRLKRNTRNVNL